MISDQAHYSIGRNVRIMGLGNDSIIRVPVDSAYRMKTSMLARLKTDAEDNGLKSISVVASACSTATGSYDDLTAIADFCEENNLWMHVDGAHGMGVLFSDKYRNLVKGVERADSVVIKCYWYQH
jgi:L-2,4-diaminobutyrate decarboxylase